MGIVRVIFVKGQVLVQEVFKMEDFFWNFFLRIGVRVGWGAGVTTVFFIQRLLNFYSVQGRNEEF